LATGVCVQIGGAEVIENSGKIGGIGTVNDIFYSNFRFTI
jgi:hypothetical protein